MGVGLYLLQGETTVIIGRMQEEREEMESAVRKMKIGMEMDVEAPGMGR